MSGFGGFGGSGFGSNQNQTTSAFGGFGSTATSGFASNTNNSSAFGSGNAGGSSLFGSSSNANTGFGGGFGANTSNSSPFGQTKPAFGAATSSPSLFGGGTATSNNTFGGFGGASTGGFGAASNSAFGSSSKPAFGASTGSNLFGGSTSNSAFGGTTQPATGFGSGSPFSSNQQNNGTGTTPFSPHTEKEPNSTQSNTFQTISAMPAYNKYSLDELRCVDYAQGRKYGNQSGQAGAFGTSTGFGGFGSSNTNTTNAFGASNTGGLFGSSNQNTSTPFGATSNTSAFGANTNTSPFGQKPAATSLFGSTAPASSTSAGLFGSGGGFGGNTTSGFGAGGGASTFGQQQNKPFSGFGSTTGGFGSTSTTPFGGQQNISAFGANTQSNATGAVNFGQQNQQQNQSGGSLFPGFGQQQQKPSLFGGNTATGGGLFGQPANQQQQTGGLFGGANQQQSGGLFGNKPASTSLFGGSATNAGNSLFGNPQQNQGSSLFGAANNQAGSGLLGAKPAASTGLGSSLFGQNQNQAQSNNLFGNSQQQSTGLGGSLFSSAQQTQQAQPSHLVANLTENPYGNAQLFAGLQTPTQNLGPLATPLSSTQKAKKQAIIPHHRIMPLASSRLITPQKRVQGYGFTYSAFNSPASVGSNSSPLGLGNSLLGSTSLNRSLGKSLSTSNLRHSFTAQDSILAPGAFSGASRSGPGSMKKLNINRSLTARRSLFGQETTTNPGKRVSFDTSVAPNGERPQPAISTALVRTESPDNAMPVADKSPPVRSQPNGSSGKELAAVPENNVVDEQALHVVNSKAQLAQQDQVAGDYFTRPSIAEIQAMRREDRANVRNFVVSREGMGSVTFSKADLTAVPLADICGKIVQIDMRRATVYGDNSPVHTPPQGQGLNVRSRIVLENSWPRKLGRTRAADHSEQAIEKHVRLLKGCKDTTFISYEASKGIWTFDVQHFTTYGLDYEEDGSPVENSMMLRRDGTSDSPEGHAAADSPAIYSPGSDSSVEDTFDFKRRKRTAIPGQFEGEALLDASMMDDVDADEADGNSFVEYDDVDDGEEAVDIDQEMAGSFPAQGDVSMAFEAPSSVSGAVKVPDAPVQEDQLHLSMNWTNQLLQTASPKKPDRQTLKGRRTQAATASDRRPLEQVTTFGTAVDIMKSLFASQGGQETEQTSEVALAQVSHDSEMSDDATSSGFPGNPAPKDLIALIPNTIVEHKGNTVVTLNAEAQRGIHLRDGFKFSSFASITNIDSNDGLHEQQLWELAGILFDEMDDVPQGLSPEAADAYRSRARKELLSSFWAKLVRPTVDAVVETADSPEEKALLYLSGGNIAEACSALLEGTNFHLAQLVAQNRGDKTFRETMARQLKDWDAIEVVSEMNDCIRTIYHLLAGETAGCGGNPQSGIENRKASFRFSSRFKLGWKRAFGLRLWYGTLKGDDIASAVGDFASDLDQGVETARPVPWFVEDMGCDASLEARQDPLWGLLRLYSRLRSGSLGTDSVKALFEPESLSRNPRDARLGFELINLLNAVGVLGKISNAGDLGSLSAVSDSLAVSYAASLAAQIPTDPEVLVLACWVLTHVADAGAQPINIRSLLDRFGDILSTNESICEALVSHDENGLRIPVGWICSSKAIYARTVMNDPVAEVRFLIEGGELGRAHDVISQTVGPAAIIEDDYTSLHDIVALVRGTDMRRRVDWDKGAGLYFDYADLIHSEKRGAEAKKLVRKLTAELEAVLAEGGKSAAEKVALQMMASSVADISRRESSVEHERVLRLPLGQGGCLAQTKLLAWSNYQNCLRL